MRGNKSKFPLKTIKKEAICNIVLSESHGSEDEREICEKLAKKYKETNIRRLSSSLKICRICEGRSNLYIRLGPINKWDIAAGDAIVRATNGVVYDLKGKDFNYKTPTSKTGEFFVLSSKTIWNSYREKNYNSWFRI